MNKTKVSIVKVDDYDRLEVRAGVKRCIGLLGGLKTIIKPGDRVFVKINHLSPSSPPERGIVTHPVFAGAVLDLLKEICADITVGDDIDSEAIDGFQVSGIRQVCREAGVRLINLREAGFVETGCNGIILDKIFLAKTALDADVIINLPKLKTHSLTIFTGGIKNMYGVIPHGHRTRFHFDYTRSEDFGQMLTDIFSAIPPQLTIMDGIMAMEGEGPSAGNPRRLGIIIASRDTVALDAVATRIIGLDPASIGTTRYCHDRGLGIGNLRDIEVAGEKIEDVAAADFKLPASHSRLIISRLPSFFSGFLMSQLFIRVGVVEKLCTGCFECEEICPAAAISKAGEKVRINQDACIQCMCCHEVCRYNAIIPEQPLMGRAMNFAVGILRKLMAAG